jgi:import receptor subunit TOM20
VAINSVSQLGLANQVKQEQPIVAVLDPDLEGKGLHCSQCLRQIDEGTALKPHGDRLASAFCSKECEAKLKGESQLLLFGPEYAIPIELNPNQGPENTMKRSDAQIAFARFVRESDKIQATLVARFIAKQVISETLKLLPPNHPSNPTTQPQAAADSEWTTNGYTLFDHMERVRFLELSGKEGEAEQLRSIMKANLPGLEEFVTDERYTTLTGKMAYNAYGISPSGGRDDKVRIFRLLHTHRNFVLMGRYYRVATTRRQARRRRVDTHAKRYSASSRSRILRRFILREHPLSLSPLLPA